MFDLQLVGLDLGKIENIVEHAEQRIRRRFNLGQIVALLRAQFCFQRQMGEPEHRVHRRAYFVAHVGQELGFGLVGRNGFGPRLLELGNGQL